MTAKRSRWPAANAALARSLSALWAATDFEHVHSPAALLPGAPHGVERLPHVRVFSHVYEPERPFLPAGL